MNDRRQASLSGQQKRTRAALLGATAQLLRDGRMPSVAEAAEAADVSRRTAYRYFPTQEQLLTEAALETLRSGIESSFADIEGDPEARLEAAVRSIQAQAIANEGLLRTMIRLTVERPAAPAPERSATRGTRRIDWIEQAVAPARATLSAGAFARLVSALALCVGGEALIVLRDVRALDERAATDVSVWTARAILREAYAEASVAKPEAG